MQPHLSPVVNAFQLDQIDGQELLKALLGPFGLANGLDLPKFPPWFNHSQFLMGHEITINSPWTYHAQRLTMDFTSFQVAFQLHLIDHLATAQERR
jgi:hypothetical protein